LGKTL